MIKISVAIPCKNEVKFITECIEAIYNSEFKEDIVLNVIVVDGMSSDGTRECVKQLMTRFNTLHLVDNEKELTPYAFNLGLNKFEFDYLQIVGARHIISKNYIAECVKALEENSEIWCAGGQIINSFSNEKSEVIAKAMSTSFGMGIGNFRTLTKTGFTDTVTSPMYPKFVFEKLGLFDERLIRNQDDDFNYRVTHSGGKILYIHEISLKYYVRTSLKNLRRQFFQYGYWKVFVNKKHKTVTTIRQLVPLLFVLFLLFAISSLAYLPLFLYFSLPILALYCLLVITFGLRLAKQFDTVGTALLVYPLMHVSYGLGYLQGIIEFLILGKTPSDKQKRLSR